MRTLVFAIFAATASAWTPGLAIARPTLRTPAPPVAVAPLGLASAALATPLGTGVALNSALAALGTAANQRVLTPSGLAHAWALGVILWSTLGLRGWSTCVIYLIGGSAVTKLGKVRSPTALANCGDPLRSPSVEEAPWCSPDALRVLAACPVAGRAAASLPLLPGQKRISWNR